MRKFLLSVAALICASTINLFAEDTRTVISKCEFTGYDPSVIQVGKYAYEVYSALYSSIKTPEGAVYYIPESMLSVKKSLGDGFYEQLYKWTDTIAEDIDYIVSFQVRIDNEDGNNYGSTYRFPKPGEGCVSITMNGEDWGEEYSAYVDDDYSYFSVILPIRLGENGFPIEVNALPGQFTINAAGDKIAFSQGNLQYQAGTSTWRFAENQYDIIGEANKNISASYSDWIDLFGWGTGTNPTNASTDYMQYDDYAEWGANKISNGGNIANAWYTLTGDEWKYLFFTRPNAATLFGLGAVNGQNGVILLPDNWTLPAGAAFTPSTENGMELDGTNMYKNSSGSNYTDNTYTATEWEVMQAAGAVFLPAAGARSGNTVVNEGSDGYYWSSTSPATLAAYAVFISANSLEANTSNRSYGFSVRLVRDASEDQTEEGIENVRRDDVQCTKFMHTGQLFIERDGKLYNALGARVK